MKDIPHLDNVDMVTLGERGQIVIPQAIRECTGLKPGDKLMVFVKHDKFIGLLPPDSFRGLVEKLARQVNEDDSIDNQTTSPNPKETI